MNQYIIPLPHNDPRLFSHVSQAFSLVDLGKRLLDAAKNGDVEEVKSLINNGAPFTTDWLGISPLHFAAMNGHLSSCDALLRAGISRDARTKVDRTPLHLAAQEGHADIVELLLRNGADLCAKDMLRMTALHWAAERGHTPVVQMLMRFGADAHRQNKFEMSPLDIAASKGHDDARSAMLHTQYDTLSSVGRMAATNGELVHANAYILTDEETLVPAAPPADEVTVTATTIDESCSTPIAENGDKLSSVLVNEKSSIDVELLPRAKLSPKSMWTTVDNELLKTTTDDIECELHFPINGDTDQELPYSLQGSISTTSNDVTETVNPINKQSNSQINLLNANNIKDIMIVETPDGETLYVCEQPNLDEPNNLLILNSLGESVNNPTLMAQLMDVLGSIPEPDSTDQLNSNNLTENAKNGNSDYPLQSMCKLQNSESDNKLSVCKRMGDPPKIDLSEVERNYSSSVYADDGSVIQRISKSRNNELEDEEDDSESLTAQLAAFVNQPQSEQTTICVEGMGAGASTHDLIMWCLCNGIFIRGYADEPTFTVEFVYQGEAHILGASYDSQSGSVTFYHIGADQK